MQKSDQHYVYCHFNDDHGVFYVGKGSGKRMFVTGNRSSEWRRCAKKNGFQAMILSLCADCESAFLEESRWISFFKKTGQCSANVSLGGKGVTVEKRWWGSKISESLTGKTVSRGKESKVYKDFCDAKELRRLYEANGLSITKIGQLYGVSSTTVLSRLNEFGIHIRDINKRGRQIVCKNTGETFQSITDAARRLGLFRENIRKVLANKYAHTGGFSFSYLGDGKNE